MLGWLLIHLSRLVLRVMLYDEPATMGTFDVHFMGLFAAGLLIRFLGLFTAAHMGLCAIRHVFSFGSIFGVTRLGIRTLRLLKGSQSTTSVEDLDNDKLGPHAVD
jgi:hypothetical protein